MDIDRRDFLKFGLAVPTLVPGFKNAKNFFDSLENKEEYGWSEIFSYSYTDLPNELKEYEFEPIDFYEEERKKKKEDVLDHIYKQILEHTQKYLEEISSEEDRERVLSEIFAILNQKKVEFKSVTKSTEKDTIKKDYLIHSSALFLIKKIKLQDLNVYKENIESFQNKTEEGLSVYLNKFTKEEVPQKIQSFLSEFLTDEDLANILNSEAEDDSLLSKIKSLDLGKKEKLQIIYNIIFKHFLTSWANNPFKFSWEKDSFNKNDVKVFLFDFSQDSFKDLDSLVDKHNNEYLSQAKNILFSKKEKDDISGELVKSNEVVEVENIYPALIVSEKEKAFLSKVSKKYSQFAEELLKDITHDDGIIANVMYKPAFELLEKTKKIANDLFNIKSDLELSYDSLTEEEIEEKESSYLAYLALSRNFLSVVEKYNRIYTSGSEKDFCEVVSNYFKNSKEEIRNLFEEEDGFDKLLLNLIEVVEWYKDYFNSERYINRLKESLKEKISSNVESKEEITEDVLGVLSKQIVKETLSKIINTLYTSYSRSDEESKDRDLLTRASTTYRVGGDTLLVNFSFFHLTQGGGRNTMAHEIAHTVFDLKYVDNLTSPYTKDQLDELNRVLNVSSKANKGYYGNPDEKIAYAFGLLFSLDDLKINGLDKESILVFKDKETDEKVIKLLASLLSTKNLNMLYKAEVERVIDSDIYNFSSNSDLELKAKDLLYFLRKVL